MKDKLQEIMDDIIPNVKFTQEQFELLQIGNIDYVGGSENPYMFFPFVFHVTDKENRVGELIHMNDPRVPKKIRYELAKGLNETIEKLKENK